MPTAVSATRPRYLYASYARQDAAAVRLFLQPLGEALKARQVPVEIWQDIERLQPGSSWRDAIREALDQSVGLLVFVSRASMASEFVRDELAAMLALRDRLIVPVIVEHVDELPQALKVRNWLDLSAQLHDPARLRIEAERLADQIGGQIGAAGGKPALPDRMAAKLADFAASTVRRFSAPADAGSNAPVAASVFVVHGHDAAARELVCGALKSYGVEPIVLSQQLGPSQSLLQKFLAVSERANFAVVVVSPDDYGASLRQYDTPGVAERALKFRARQNVILELGFFYGHLGWENVFVLQRPPPRVFPDFEPPSDLAGAVFDEIDEAGQWKQTLAEKLRAAGFTIAAPGSR